ncbi:MAG: hypothetical protein ACT4PJ_09660 [Gemmatimonadaceae bacterium]
MTYRNALRALLASAICAPGAIAQSGVLIGTSSPAGYETLWIVGDASRPVQATIPDLLVPRADGWWRIGTARICSTGGPESQSMTVLWRTPADSASAISEICHELPRGELPLPIYADDSAARDSLAKELVRCSWSDIHIKFVSPEYLAVGERSGQTEECEPRGGRWYQSFYVSLFNGDSSLALAQFAGTRVDSIGRQALASAAKDLAKDEVCTSLAQGFDSRELLEVGAAWYPTRARGRWMPVLMEELGTGECQLLPIIDVALTEALTGHDSPRPSWQAISKQVRGLEDVLTSPVGDVVILRTSDSLYVHLGAGEKLGRRVGAMPFGDHEIVMIQWTTGRNVARWTKEIAALMKRGLAGPLIVPPLRDP